MFNAEYKKDDTRQKNKKKKEEQQREQQSQGTKEKERNDKDQNQNDVLPVFFGGEALRPPPHAPHQP